MIFPVAQEPPLWPVDLRPPCLLATWSVAPDLDVAVPRVPGGGTVAQLPGDRDSARLPRMVETALGRPGHTGHLASRTHFRIADSQWAVNHSRTRTVSLGSREVPPGYGSDLPRRGVSFSRG